MRLLPLLLFIAVPLAEIVILIKIGEIIGIAATILLVISTAVLGVSLLKRQGLAALARARSSLDAGEIPVESVIDGVSLLIAGAFLLTPGLLTDMVGFSLLVPAFRFRLARWIIDKFKNSDHMQVHTFGMGPGTGPGTGHGAPGAGQHPHRGPGSVIEGEFKDMEDEPSEDQKTEEEPLSPKSSDPKSSPWRK
jgi:UPF0716 protein FxsA